MIYIHNLYNPTLLSIGFLKIHYYALSYLAGLMLLPYWLNKNYLKDNNLKEKFSGYAVFSMLIFARIFYVLFYNFDYYQENPSEIIAIWMGGLSFHGGLVGVIVGVFLFCRKYKKNPMIVFDNIAIPTSICLFIGRIMNFVNGELFGRATSGSWGVVFAKTDPLLIPRHPSQLYESFTEGLLLFLILLIIKKYAKLRNGQLAAIFLIGYSFFRFIIEFFREPDEQVGFLFRYLTMGQILCSFMVISGAGLFFYLKKSPRYENF
jgi:phosphatidylglycerol:prolipoprotein diacylglycerol transferase